MADLKIRERTDLQRLLRDNIEIVSKGTLIISEEYTGWVGSLRRIDLLGIDPDGTLVVFELKRTEDGGHMDLQGIRYAAMASLLSFKEVVEVYAAYLSKCQRDEDAESLLRDHLDPEIGGEVASAVRIVLVSADFGQEMTTTVLWLNQRGLDIRCVRMVPYDDGGSIYFDVQQIIPVPEAADYTIKLREKEERKQIARQGERDFTRFVVMHEGGRTDPLPKRRAMLEIVRILVRKGHSPEKLQKIFKRNRFLVTQGTILTSHEFASANVRTLRDGNPGDGNSPRHFTDDDELLHHDDRTYAFSHQWGSNTREVMKTLLEQHRDIGISVEEVP